MSPRWDSKCSKESARCALSHKEEKLGINAVLPTATAACRAEVSWACSDEPIKYYPGVFVAQLQGLGELVPDNGNGICVEMRFHKSSPSFMLLTERRFEDGHLFNH